MGRKTGSGGSDHRFLSRDIEEIKNCNNYVTVAEFVKHLRSKYNCYARLKLQPFTKCVSEIINKKDDVDSGDNNKKRRKIDPAGEEIVEAQHIKRRRRSSSGSSSIASTGSSSETDDDAIYGEKSKPEIDLMTSMLRANYGRKSKELTGARGVQEELELELELEVVENKDGKIENLVSEGGSEQVGVGGGDVQFNRKDNNSDRGDGNESKGPMFKDFRGMTRVIEELKKEVIVPYSHPQLLRYLGVKPLSGILLHGPPGCGKTTLAHAIANETKIPFYKTSATELVSGVSGASEENIRELFSKAYRTAPSIVFIDEIDAIASKREDLQTEMGRRIVTQLMYCMDELRRKPVDGKEDSESSYCKHGYVLVIGTTNRPDAVDRALRRPGRFEREFFLGVPDESARAEILSMLVSNLKVEGAFDHLKIARSTPGFVGTDLVAIANKAGNLALNRIVNEGNVELFSKQVDREDIGQWSHPRSNEELEMPNITVADFEEGVKFVQPSSRREGFSTVPNVKWDDVGGLHSLKKEFNRYITRPIKYPEYYERMKLETGFLLYGPPGCGKTLIAKAVANEAGANFIHIKGPEILSKYVGESESEVRKIFSRARTCSPCIVFFDEVDALTTKQGKEGGWVVVRLLKQLDGAEDRRGIYVIGATNRPDVMDPALFRPGRFGKRVLVTLPTPDERGMILRALARKMQVDPSVDLIAIGKDSACEGFSGADLSSLMHEAYMLAVDDIPSPDRSSDGTSSSIIRYTHIKRALATTSPSVSNKQIRRYERWSKKFK